MSADDIRRLMANPVTGAVLAAALLNERIALGALRLLVTRGVITGS